MVVVVVVVFVVATAMNSLFVPAARRAFRYRLLCFLLYSRDHDTDWYRVLVRRVRGVDRANDIECVVPRGGLVHLRQRYTFFWRKWFLNDGSSLTPKSLEIGIIFG